MKRTLVTILVLLAVWLTSVQAASETNDFQTLAGKDRPEEAISTYENAAQQSPTNGVAWWELGEACRKQGRVTEAIQAYGKAGKLDAALKEQSVSRLKSEGFVMMQKDRYADATSAYQQALDLNSRDTEAIYMVGLSQVAQRNWLEATTAFQQAVKLKPGFDSAWLGLGYALSAQQQFTNAIDAFQQVVKLNPKSVTAWSGIVACATESDQKEKAAGALEFVRQLDPKAAEELVRKFPVLK